MVSSSSSSYTSYDLADFDGSYLFLAGRQSDIVSAYFVVLDHREGLVSPVETGNECIVLLVLCSRGDFGPFLLKS